MKISLLEHIIGLFVATIASAYLTTVHLDDKHIKEITTLNAQLSVCEDNYDDYAEVIEHLMLVQRLMDDGATLKQAEQIIEVSEEAGISPKL